MELHWQPDPERARLEHAALSRFIGQELQDRLGWETADLTHELTGDLCHPVMFVIAWAAIEGADQPLSAAEGLRAVQESRRRALEEVRGGSLWLDLVPPDQAVIAPTLRRARNMARSVDGTEEGFVFHHPGEIEARDAVSQARELIEANWPQMLEELEAIVSCLTFFTAGASIGFADIRTHGLIGLRRSDLSNTTLLAEEIIHESSHVRLNGVLASTDCLYDDGGRLYATPLRKDPRPAPGLLHQLFVLARLCEWHIRLGGRAIPERAALQRDQLAFAYDVVRNELPLTDAGRELVSTIEPTT